MRKFDYKTILTEEDSFVERLLLLVFCIFFSFSFSILPIASRSQMGIFRRLALALPPLGIFAAGVIVGSTIIELKF
jgi:hypothetical protein